LCKTIRQEDPVSRILSCAVIPLGAALPRTLISDLPGGFDKCSSRLGASGRCAAAAWLLAVASLPIWSCSVWGLPCPGLYRTGGALLPHHFTLTPALEIRNGKRIRQAGPTRVLRLQGGPRLGSNGDKPRGSRGGIFSVALAVHGPSRPRPGRYPAHCPAEFGLSSPGGLSRVREPPAATARSSCQSLVYRTSAFAESVPPFYALSF